MYKVNIISTFFSENAQYANFRESVASGDSRALNFPEGNIHISDKGKLLKNGKNSQGLLTMGGQIPIEKHYRSLRKDQVLMKFKCYTLSQWIERMELKFQFEFAVLVFQSHSEIMLKIIQYEPTVQLAQVGSKTSSLCSVFLKIQVKL